MHAHACALTHKTTVWESDFEEFSWTPIPKYNCLLNNSHLEIIGFNLVHFKLSWSKSVNTQQLGELAFGQTVKTMGHYYHVRLNLYKWKPKFVHLGLMEYFCCNIFHTQNHMFGAYHQVVTSHQFGDAALNWLIYDHSHMYLSPPPNILPKTIIRVGSSTPGCLHVNAHFSPIDGSRYLPSFGF